MLSEQIIVVSGLPRSGTSMMMQILAAGGIDLLIDEHRPSNIDNPNGYFEFSKVKRLAQDNGWMGLAKGKAIKIVSPLLYNLPPQWQYKIIFMTRDLDEIITSQDKMLSRSNTNIKTVDSSGLKDKFEAHLSHIKSRISSLENHSVLYIGYRDMLDQADIQAAAIQKFLNCNFSVERAREAIDLQLYRNRSN